MTQFEKEQKVNSISDLISHLFVIGLWFILALIFTIKGNKEYGWFAGLFHGNWAVCNWIISWFKESAMVKAPLHTTAYNIWWWIGFIFGLWHWIKTVLRLIFVLRLRPNE